MQMNFAQYRLDHKFDKDMPAALRATLPKPVPFEGAMHAFKMSSTSQAGSDYDIPNQPAAYDQLDEGSCVLNSTVGAMSIVLGVEKQAVVMLSRNFLYWLCRLSMGTTSQDSGTYSHLAVDRVGSIGVCSESTWAYGDATLYVPPSLQAYSEASDNKATSWFQLDSPQAVTPRLTQIEASVRSNHPVIFGTPVDQTIQTYQPGQILTTPDSNAIIGGHEMVVTGVHYVNGQRVWIWRNSWGTSYGNNGYLMVDDNWMNWAQLQDIWNMTRMSPLLF
jgi:hypothetical protein